MKYITGGLSATYDSVVLLFLPHTTDRKLCRWSQPNAKDGWKTSLL